MGRDTDKTYTTETGNWKDYPLNLFFCDFYKSYSSEAGESEKWSPVISTAEYVYWKLSCICVA